MATTPSEAPPEADPRPPAEEQEPPAPWENFFDWLFRAIVFLFIDGPDPVERDEDPSLLEVLLPWPVRLAVVGGLVWAASFWGDAGVGQQLAWGLEVGGFCLTSIIATYWLVLLLADCLLAAAWLVPFEARKDAPHRHEFLYAITFVNRQIEHMKALVVWLLVAFTWSSMLTAQVGIAASALLLGLPVINGLARLLPGNDSKRKKDGGLYWRRRLLIYAATLGGLLALALSAPGQLRQLACLFAAFAGGLALRIFRHLRRGRDVKRDKATGKLEKLADRDRFRREQAKTAQRADPYGPLLVLLGALALVALSFWQRRQLARELEPAKDAKAAEPNECPKAPDPLATSSIALFVMADTQTHELSGEPFPGQTELANVFARTATRPVELDMLSGIPVQRFLQAYADFARERAGRRLSPPFWAHLGDMADIGCHKELDRITALLEPFSKVGPMASVAVGNHEKNFVGSFHWSPYWDTACKSGRMLPDEATTALEERFGKLLPKGGQMVREAAAYFNPSGATLASVIPLGVSTHQQIPRGLIGIFLDTSDGRAFDFGNPGSFGAVSAGQLARLKEAIARVRTSAPYDQHPVYVLFQHVPFDALASDSKKRVTEFILELDGLPKERAGASSGPNVLGLFSAHTHVSARRNHCINDRNLQEVVVGSTVDPPQQAALVEIGPDAEGGLTLRTRTLAAVARDGATCEEPRLGVTARECRAVAARLTRLKSCRKLLGADTTGEPRDCQELEHAGTFALRLDAIRKYQGPRTEKRRRELEEASARTLLECVCHEDENDERDQCRLTDRPLWDESYLAIVARKAKHPEHQQEHDTELACLAWAAGAMQAHKDANMTMAEAMRCAFDDPTLPPEQRTSVTLGAVPCD